MSKPDEPFEALWKTVTQPNPRFEAWFKSLVIPERLRRSFVPDKASARMGWAAALNAALATCDTRTDVDSLVGAAMLGESTVLVGKAAYAAMKAVVDSTLGCIDAAANGGDLALAEEGLAEAVVAYKEICS